MKEKFKVDGMMCASCQAHVNQAVAKINGVENVNVSLIEKNMVVEYDNSKTNYNEIISKVQQAGYQASIFHEETYQEVIRKRTQVLKNKLKKLIISAIFLLLLMFVSMGHMLAMEFNWPFFTHNPLILLPLQIVFLIPIIVLNFDYFTRGYKALFSLRPNMDSLVCLGSTASIIYGLYAFIYIIVLTVNDPSNPLIDSLASKVYFESAGTIVTLVSLGKYFESKSLDSTMSSIYRLMELTPSQANVMIDNKEVKMEVKDIPLNSLIVIKPGDRIPLDGVIVSGYGNLDESSLTGEALPLYKKEGDKVISGTVNKQGSFVFKCTLIGKDTTVNKIIALVQEASSSKAKMAKLVDRVSLYFVPSVMLISLITFVTWMFISQYNVDLSFNFAISVLVISCPCALGLATPVTIMVGTGKGAQNGILIRSAQAFENLASIDTIILDKTGTLTKGLMEVESTSLSLEDLTLVASLEANSSHPLSLSIVKYVQNLQPNLKKTDDFTYLPGLGLKGTINSDSFIIGNSKLCESYLTPGALNDLSNFADKGKTVIFVVKNELYLGYIAIGDSLKDNAIDVIKALKKLNKEVVLLTGDNQKSADYFASILGINKVFANVLPDQKLSKITELQKEGHKVMMVGDGINDAPSLIQAEVGMAIGAGSDIAIDAADIILIRSDLSDIVSALLLSKKVVNNIKANLFWAFFYNTIAIPFASGCFYFAPLFIMLNPMIASLAMALSSLTVVLNALRLNFFKRQEI